MIRSIGKYSLLICTLVFISFNSFSQDSIVMNLHLRQDSAMYRFTPKKLIIPGIFIAYGVASMHVKPLERLNQSTHNEVVEDHPSKNNLDDYTRYLPAAMVYGLNAFGVNGKHNFKERTILFATSQIILGATTLSAKHFAHEERPDQSNDYSFPSGHAAMAFANAQFLFREYHDSNFWLSLAGYPIAIFTGTYRIINDKHWVGDVVAGAGFGILSTEAAYWLYPTISKWFAKKDKQASAMILPYYQNNTIGLSLVKLL
ncbi:phosphatase PAP2 family protein [Rhizosphaericola mali]|uniref:Phosphatase PAP2 family protein n=1 Tax=Rhizosphaericola mali TaxID=2545455 RepID=A0A5P2FW48_9BACT|nr:phosphatase PAP2 family protein [Rhizosphaericola mali]QES87746.1 phosphatase PAP2 family protein [Rhizosphaericola mali]